MQHPFSKKSRAYLDWASAAPVLPAASSAFMEAAVLFGNPSSPHGEGVEARAALEASRTRIARLAGVKPHSVIFTSGATEANALAIHGRLRKLNALGEAYRSMHLLYLPTMHASALKAVLAAQTLGVRAQAIPFAPSSVGAIDMDAFARLLRPDTVLVITDVVCGETGVRFDVLRLKRTIDAAGYDGTAILHVDASQLPLSESIDRTRLGADSISLDAQKIGGVRGVGALILPHHETIQPLYEGGGQEGGMRSGTEPVALIAAFAEALERRAEGVAVFAGKAARMREAFLEMIMAALPQTQVLSAKRQASHILNLQFPGMDTDYLVMLLDAAGISVSTKSACETDSEDGSKALMALTGDAERAAATLRISWGPETEEGSLRTCAEEMVSTVRFLKESAI